MLDQKALIITQDTLDALNEHLRSGWTVLHATPMGGGGQSSGFASLVVIEQRAAAAEEILGQIEGALEAPSDAPDVQDPLLRRLQGDADDLGPLTNRG